MLAAAAGCTPEFASVPAGAFVMGSPAGELGRDADEGEHGVSITRDLEFGATEVTQKQFQDRLGYN
ncbi:MAG: hypothetical protein K8I02_13355, partial [Candidatus Methylomirabilis sp.]|nr:hypothetical protein [Deltaproteobacteria bacterium]